MKIRVLYWAIICLIVVSCGNQKSSNNDYSVQTSLYDNYNNADNDDYYNDDEYQSSTSGYKYNYKNNGYYNYDISGYDEDGNYVSGNVDIDEYGEGYIEDEYGNEKYIEVKWTDWGVMEGYDEDGVYYELGVE